MTLEVLTAAALLKRKLARDENEASAPPAAAAYET